MPDTPEPLPCPWLPASPSSACAPGAPYPPAPLAQKRGWFMPPADMVSAASCLQVPFIALNVWLIVSAGGSVYQTLALVACSVSFGFSFAMGIALRSRLEG